MPQVVHTDANPFPTRIGIDRYRAQVLVLQSLVSIVLSYQVLATPETVLARPVQEILVLGLLSLIGAAFLLPIHVVETRAFTIVLLLIDTAVTSCVIYVTEQLGSDLYLAYFLIILISASMRTLWQKTLFSALIAASYATILFLTQGESVFLKGHLIRISILLIMGVVYSVMSEALELEHRDKVGLLEEVTERTKAEDKLKASESLLRNLQEITIDTVDWEQRLHRMLSVGCASLDMATGVVMEITGDHYEIRHIVTSEVKAKRGDRAPIKDSYCEWTIQSREPVTFCDSQESDWRPPSQDPLLAPQAFAGVPIFTGGGVYGCICFSDAASGHRPFAGYEKTFLKLCAQWIGHELERQATDADIRRAKEQAEAASRAKTEFLATMSHEIRTPMNAVVGMADLLWDTPLSLDQKEYLGIVRRSSTHLLDLINDILDVSKIEAGHFVLEELPFDLNDLLDKCAEALALRVQEKGLELMVSIDSDVSTDLVGDPRVLRQVVWNLLGNAIKFTEQGEIALRVSQHPGGRHARMLRFAVSDTGIGIAPDKHASVFEQFSQADSSITRMYGGTGLGLTISKRLVELSGGQIWLESEAGKGSTFYFALPFGPAAASRTTGSPDLTGRRVQLAIGHPGLRAFVQGVLSDLHASVMTAPDIETAVKEIRDAGAMPPYSLFVLDATNMIASRLVPLLLEVRNAGVAVITIVPDVRSEIIAASYEWGVGGYVTKPITTGKLVAVIERVLVQGPREPQPLEAVSVGVSAGSAGRILMAEDSPDNQRLIQLYLKKTEYQLDLAGNGQAAFEMYTRGRYDVVLMDMQMPIMDGLATTRKIREWEKQCGRKHVPIIALTAQALKEEMRESLDAGCSGHLTKPIRKATLLSEIQRWMDGAHGAPQ
jgi:signal transduction histidine kinase/DNA-binding response OmpR family regulator